MNTQTNDPRASIARELARYYAELSGVEPKSQPRFSLGRAIREAATERGLHDGYEKEVCGGAALMSGGHHDPHRIIVPFGALAQRDLTATSAAAGGYLIGTATPEPVDILRTWSVVASAGITTLTGLRENLAIPRVSTAPTGAWVAEDGVVGRGDRPPELVGERHGASAKSTATRSQELQCTSGRASQLMQDLAKFSSRAQ